MKTIGLYTKYRRLDSTLEAIAVAKQFESNGSRVSIRARGQKINISDPDYDNRVSKGSLYVNPHAADKRPIVQFRERVATKQWFSKQSSIIWTDPPDEELAAYANYELKIPQICFVSWDTIHKEDIWALNATQKVILPSRWQMNSVAGYTGLQNAYVAPYIPPVPVVTKVPRFDNKVRLFLSLCGSQLARVKLGIITTITRTLYAKPNVTCTIAYPNGLNYRVLKILKRVSEATGRLNLICTDSWYDQIAMMATADLTIWPPIIDGCGIIGLTSLMVGTPVIAFDIPPINEYLISDENAVLVRTPVTVRWSGAVIAEPSYVVFGDKLEDIVSRPDYLAMLTFNATNTRKKWLAYTAEAWAQILPAE